jgi:hypothetical protein
MTDPPSPSIGISNGIVRISGYACVRRNIWNLMMHILKLFVFALLFTIVALLSGAEAQQQKRGPGPVCDYGTCVAKCNATSGNPRGCANFCQKQIADRRYSGQCK